MANELKEKHQRLKKVRTRNIVLNSICILLAGSGIWWTANYFWRYINYEVTNDAFVDQYIAPLNIRASGYIKEVRFKEHQYVHQGDTLLILDDREYRIKVKEAEAALIDAQGSQDVLRSGIETSHTNIAVQDANIAEAKAKLWQLEQDYHRFERLLKEESVPEQQYEQSKAAFEAAQARYQALVEQKKAAFSQFTETSKKTTGAEAAILRKEADLDLARLNLSYTVITAPYDGHVGRRTLEPGQYVQAGQTISYLVRDKDKWITANYKETQTPPHLYRAKSTYQGRRVAGKDIQRGGNRNLRRHRLQILIGPDRQFRRKLRQGTTTYPGTDRLGKSIARRYAILKSRHDG